MSEFELALRKYDEASQRLAVALSERDDARNRLLKMHADLLGCITMPTAASSPMHGFDGRSHASGEVRCRCGQVFKNARRFVDHEEKEED